MKIVLSAERFKVRIIVSHALAIWQKTATWIQTMEENTKHGHSPSADMKLENEKATKENANVEVEKEAKDAPLILDYISTLSSKSGKDVLLLWVKDHPEACATAQAAAIKCSGKQPRAPPFKKSMATKRKKEENKATNKRKAKK
jgi:hypothetical protein